jgi:hypothetical protein
MNPMSTTLPTHCRNRRKSKLPFGAFLVAGPVAVILGGRPLGEVMMS